MPFYAKIGKKRLGKKWYSTFLCDIRRFFWPIIRRNLILQIKTSNITKKNQYHFIYSTFFWLKFTIVESPFFSKSVQNQVHKFHFFQKSKIDFSLLTVVGWFWSKLTKITEDRCLYPGCLDWRKYVNTQKVTWYPA